MSGRGMVPGARPPADDDDVGAAVRDDGSIGAVRDSEELVDALAARAPVRTPDPPDPLVLLLSGWVEAIDAEVEAATAPRPRGALRRSRPTAAGAVEQAAAARAVPVTGRHERRTPWWALSASAAAVIMVLAVGAGLQDLSGDGTGAGPALAEAEESIESILLAARAAVAAGDAAGGRELLDQAHELVAQLPAQDQERFAEALGNAERVLQVAEQEDLGQGAGGAPGGPEAAGRLDLVGPDASWLRLQPVDGSTAGAAAGAGAGAGPTPGRPATTPRGPFVAGPVPPPVPWAGPPGGTAPATEGPVAEGPALEVPGVEVPGVGVPGTGVPADRPRGAAPAAGPTTDRPPTVDRPGDPPSRPTTVPTVRSPDEAPAARPTSKAPATSRPTPAPPASKPTTSRPTSRPATRPEAGPPTSGPVAPAARPPAAAPSRTPAPAVPPRGTGAKPGAGPGPTSGPAGPGSSRQQADRPAAAPGDAPAGTRARTDAQGDGTSRGTASGQGRADDQAMAHDDDSGRGNGNGNSDSGSGRVPGKPGG